MKKTQLVILIAGLVAVILLFRLPKVLVADTQKIQEENSVESSDEQPAFDEVHSGAVTKVDPQKMTRYKKEFNSLTSSEKKVIFADSIANLYRKSGLYDSAAYYIGLKADVKKSEKFLTEAADAYYEAFSASGGSSVEFNDKAREYYQKAVESNPENLDVKAKLAMTYVATENPMQGISILREVIQKDPENETALYNLGILSMQSGQYDKAVKRFSTLLNINPGHANGRFYLGLAYLNTGKTGSAEEEFLKAKELESDPGFQSVVDSYLKELKK